MTRRPLLRTALALAATGAAVAALVGMTAPAASADRPDRYGPFAQDASLSSPLLQSRGQGTLHSPNASESLGRKFQ